VSLEDRLESGLASAWRPDQEDPDVIIGEVTEISFASSDYEPYPLIVIRQEDGTEKAVHAFHTVLKNELLRQKPNIGERIGIKYLGEQPTKPGSKFKSFIGYRVKVDRKAGTFDWNQVGQPSADVDPYQQPEPAAVTVPEGAGDDDIPF
jgi:hypothetical protein